MSVRRLSALIGVLVAVLVGGLLSALPAAAAKDYRAERFHSRLVVEPGGSVVVTETVRFVFGADSFTSVYRDLPSRETDGIVVLGATMDGVPLTQGKQAGQFELKKDDDGRRRIVWHFPATSGSARTFTVSYRAAGVAWQDAESDVLAWTLLPTKHAYEIACASGEVEYPASATLIGDAVLDPPATESSVEGRAVRFLRCPFGRDRSWVVTMRFAPRTLAAAPPAWQARARLNRQHLPMFLGLAALILVGGAGMFLLFGLNHRAPVAGSSGEGRQETPPDDLPPALAGALLRTGASAAWGDVLGAMMDLARRGVIRIEAQPAGGVFGKRAVTVTRGETAPRTMAHERTLLDLLFTSRSGPRSSVTFTDLARTFASARRWKRVRLAVADDLRAARLLDPEREHTRVRVTVIGVAILVLAFVGFMVSVAFLDRAGDPVLAVPGAAMLVGIIGIVTGAVTSPLSEDGAWRAGRWRAFRRYLADVAGPGGASREPRVSVERLLPYAVALGTALAWMKRLEKQGVSEGPSWLATAVREGGVGPANMAATIAILSAGSNAGAHAGGSAHGAGGVAGGGASGAG